MNRFIQINSKHLWIMILLFLLMMVMPAFAKTNAPTIKDMKINESIIDNKKAPRTSPALKTLPENLKFIKDITTSTSRLEPGKALTVSAVVKNSGIKKSKSYKVNFYIAKDLEGKKETLLKSMRGSLLSPNSSKQYKTSLTIPDNQPPGSWKIVAKIEQSGIKPVKDSSAKNISVYTQNFMQAKKENLKDQQKSTVRRARPAALPSAPAIKPLKVTKDAIPSNRPAPVDPDYRPGQRQVPGTRGTVFEEGAAGPQRDEPETTPLAEGVKPTGVGLAGQQEPGAAALLNAEDEEELEEDPPPPPPPPEENALVQPAMVQALLNTQQGSTQEPDLAPDRPNEDGNSDRDPTRSFRQHDIPQSEELRPPQPGGGDPAALRGAVSSPVVGPDGPEPGPIGPIASAIRNDAAMPAPGDGGGEAAPELRRSTEIPNIGAPPDPVGPIAREHQPAPAQRMGRDTRRQSIVPSSAVSSPVDTQGRISSVSPQPVEVGASLTIAGSDFGDERGTVSIAFDTTMVDCRIESWHDNRIVVKIPELVEPIVGETTTSARVWVFADGKEHGPSTLIDVKPNEARLTPVVTSVSPNGISPGQIVYLNGRNFLTQGPQSRIDFRLSNPISGTSQVMYAGVITNWQDTSISVQFPEDISGGFHLQNPIDIEVRNNAGNSVSTSSSVLNPPLERVVIKSDQVYYSDYSGKCENRDKRNRTYRAFEGKRLLNGWKVVSAEAYASYCWCGIGPGARYNSSGTYSGNNCTAEIIGSPQIGTNNPEVDVAVSFKPPEVTSIVKVTIEGPVGVPYE